MKFTQLQTEYVLFQIPFIVAYNRPVLEKAVFSKYVFKSNETTEHTEHTYALHR